MRGGGGGGGSMVEEERSSEEEERVILALTVYTIECDVCELLKIVNYEFLWICKISEALIKCVCSIYD